MKALKAKILIVEDEPQVAKTISRMLPLCEQVDIAFDIDLALRYADQYDYTIVFVDLLFGTKAQGANFYTKA